MVAFLLLLISLVCFSGAAQACLLLVDPAARHDTCCQPVDNQPSDEPTSPCSSPECQCLGCSGALIQAIIRITGSAPVSIAGISFNAGFLPSGFTSPIDYPPEFV